jgi:toxin-antitoxin system PIN domain toxin
MSGACLLDVNVLLALFWPDNPDHFIALHWFEQNYKKGWATCLATQAGFVRLSSNRAFTINALSPSGAISLLEKNVRHPNHEFWAESIELVQLLAPLQQRITGYRQIADACLLALAMKKRGRLVTFDKGIAALLPPGTHKSDWIVELSSRVH